MIFHMAENRVVSIAQAETESFAVCAREVVLLQRLQAKSYAALQ